MKTYRELTLEAKATYCGRCGTTHVPPSKGGTCPALKKEESGDLSDACWKGYKAIGMKKKGGKMVPNCVPEEVDLTEGTFTDSKVRYMPGRSRSKWASSYTWKHDDKDGWHVKDPKGVVVHKSKTKQEAMAKAAELNTSDKLNEYALDSFNGGGDDVFNATNIKGVERSPKHGYNPGEDEKVYEEVELDEMDKSQTPPGRGSENEYDPNGKTYNVKPVSSKKMEKDSLNALKKSFLSIKKEEVELQEGKMAQLHADIESAIGKHVKAYNAGHLGDDQFGEKVIAAHKKISKLHGIAPEHAKKFVNDYVDQNMKEEVDPMEDENELIEAHTTPKTKKEKDLAALAHPKDKITHKDVLVGRGVLKKEGWDSKKAGAVSEGKDMENDEEEDDDEDDVPFEGPYSKTKMKKQPGQKTPVDYSRVRAAARDAMNKMIQKNRMKKEGLEVEDEVVNEDVIKMDTPALKKFIATRQRNAMGGNLTRKRGDQYDQAQAELKKRKSEGMKEEVEELDEKAVSQAQQKFMGMVHAYKKGEMKNASPEIKKAAASMTGKEAKKFASTKHKGLPEKVKEDVEDLDEGNKENKAKKNEYVANIIRQKLHPSVLPSLKYGRRELKKEELETMLEEMGTPDIKVRKTYTDEYAKSYNRALRLNPKGASARAKAMAYDAVQSKHGAEARNALEAFHDKNQSEEVQQIDELSPMTYAKAGMAAAGDIEKRKKEREELKKQGLEHDSEVDKALDTKRQQSIARAGRLMAREESDPMEEYLKAIEDSMDFTNSK